MGHDKSQDNYIKTTLREISRLVIEYRKYEGKSNAGLRTLVQPTKFLFVTKATRKVGGFDEHSHTFSSPSVALKLGHTLNKVCLMELGQALITGDETAEHKAKGFLKLLESK